MSEQMPEPTTPVDHLPSLLAAAMDPCLILRHANGELSIVGGNDAWAEMCGTPMRDLMRRSPAMCMSHQLVATLDDRVGEGLGEHLERLDESPDHAVGDTPVCIALLGLAPANGQTFVMVFARAIETDTGDSHGDRILNALGRPVITIGRDLAISYVNPAATALVGFATDKLIGADVRALATDESVAALSGHLAATSSTPTSVNLSLRTADGQVNVEATTTLIRDPEPSVIIALHDLSGHAEDVANLAVLSSVDALTGLANRQTFSEHLRGIISAGVDAEVTVAFLDVDNFKTINDALGHDAGDTLLETLAQRLEHTIGDHGLVARFGGDEFVVASSGDAGTGHEELAYLLDMVFAQPVELNGTEYNTTASIGVVTTAAATTSPSELLKAADAAMYEAKRRGKDCLALYDESLQNEATARMELETDLRQALERDEFVLHYQPIMDVISGRPVGAEALVRWEHPNKGMVRPDEFIPIAEQTGLIVPLGSWVLETAIEQAAEWNKHRVSRRALGISVNLSGLQLTDPDLEQHIEAALSRHGFDPSRLTLEITESMLMSDTAETMARLGRLREMGVRIAIDDFGTGYSSLAYLKKLPAKALKIDKAFVDGLGVSTEDTSLVTGIIGLASALGFEIVAEGVETELQLKELRRLGCEYSQGYHHAKPLAAAEFAVWLGGGNEQTEADSPAEIGSRIAGEGQADSLANAASVAGVFDQDAAAFGA